MPVAEHIFEILVECEPLRARLVEYLGELAFDLSATAEVCVDPAGPGLEYQ